MGGLETKVLMTERIWSKRELISKRCMLGFIGSMGFAAIYAISNLLENNNYDLHKEIPYVLSSIGGFTIFSTIGGFNYLLRRTVLNGVEELKKSQPKSQSFYKDKP